MKWISLFSFPKSSPPNPSFSLLFYYHNFLSHSLSLISIPNPFYFPSLNPSAPLLINSGNPLPHNYHQEALIILSAILVSASSHHRRLLIVRDCYTSQSHPSRASEIENRLSAVRELMRERERRAYERERRGRDEERERPVCLKF